MNTITWLVLLASLSGGGTETFSFDSATLGRMPSGWSAVTPGSDTPPNWEILKDPTAPTPPYVFAQVSKNGGHSPLAILNQSSVRDGEVSVKFKPVGVGRNQAAGLVFRYRDPYNYYVVRASAFQKDVMVFMVQDGQRIPLMPRGRPESSFSVRHEVRPNDWNILKVAFQGAICNVYYDHRRILQVVDPTYTGPGKVGLWTSADSVTYFDNFRLFKKR